MSEERGVVMPRDLEEARRRIRELEEFAIEQEGARAALTKSESEHRIAFENSGTCMAVLREDMTIIMANQKIEEFTGFPNDIIRYKKKWTEFVHPGDIDRLAGYHLARRARPDDSGAAPAEYEFRLVDKDGGIREVFANVTMIPGTTHSLVSMIDISGRKAMERELRASEERFRTIFERSPIGIALFGPTGLLLDKNYSFLAMFEFADRSANAVRMESLLGLTDDESVELRKGRGINREASYSAAKGPSRWLEWYVTPLRVSDSGPGSYLVQAEDVTERRARAEALIAGLRHEILGKARFHDMVSRSTEMQAIFSVLPEIAAAAAPVLVNGESGTGKELVARSLHDLSSRARKPFVAINCAALPDTLLESELFGYKAGAFTDAKKDKPGKFALAEGGTIFFDEIGDISGAMQAKLLRVLQERMYEPLGGTSSLKTDVRVIAATNRDLADMVKRGAFREDLYYRINVVTIRLPPLRDRVCDIPLLCDHFLSQFNARYGKSIEGIEPSAMQAILTHSFPGNIRELENVIEHAFVFCKSGMIGLAHLPSVLREAVPGADVSGASDLFAGVKGFGDLERMYLESVLRESGSRLEAAQRLGIHKATLFRKLKKLGISGTD